MDGLQLAKLLAAANAAPSGGADLAHYTGQILSWDELSGLNSVQINGAPVANLTVLQSGIGLQYRVGDVVLVEKRMSQWCILGKLAAPGAGLTNQIASASVATFESTASTSYTNLTTAGPAVTINIGSSRRCLVTIASRITYASTGTTPNSTYIGGMASFDVAGASTIGASDNRAEISQMWHNSPTVPVAGVLQASYSVLLTSADGLNAGLNTFTMRYRSSGSDPACGFSGRNITVTPL